MTNPSLPSNLPTPGKGAILGATPTPADSIDTLKAAIQNQNVHELSNQLNTIKPDRETFKKLLAQVHVPHVLLPKPLIETLLNYAEQAQGGHLEEV